MKNSKIILYIKYQGIIKTIQITNSRYIQNHFTDFFKRYWNILDIKREQFNYEYI